MVSRMEEKMKHFQLDEKDWQQFKNRVVDWQENAIH